MGSHGGAGSTEVFLGQFEIRNGEGEMGEAGGALREREMEDRGSKIENAGGGLNQPMAED